MGCNRLYVEATGGRRVSKRVTESTPESAWKTYLQSAEYCQLDRVTLWRTVKRGELRAGGVGRAVRFHRDELDRWMRGDEEK